MTFLLDVSALIALGFAPHEFHERVFRWVSANPTNRIATCSITELGFLRILSQRLPYGLTIEETRLLFHSVKESLGDRHRFLIDGNSADQLPRWVATAKGTTDGHLLGLAQAHDANLATFDRGIPGAFLIS